MAKRNEKTGRFSGMIEPIYKGNTEALLGYHTKRKQEMKEAGLLKPRKNVQYSPLKKYGRKNTRVMHNHLRVKEGESHDQWLKRTAKYRIPTVEDASRSRKTLKVYRIYSTLTRKENVQKQKEVFDERFNERPQLFLKYLWALFGYYEAKFGLDRNHFQFILYLDALHRPFSKEEFLAKCMAFNIDYKSFKYWQESRIITDIGITETKNVEIGMYRLTKDITLLCYNFYNYLTGDKMVPQLKGDKQNKTTINKMLLELHEEMIPYLEGTKKQEFVLRVDQEGNIIK